MPLYLVRHAHAVPEAENPRRPLSERGRSQIRTLVDFFRLHHRFTPAYVWHSPLLRARETAELLLGGLNNEAALIETAGLLPDDAPAETAARLAAINSAVNIAIVGHQPHLGALASLLLGQPAAADSFPLRKASVLTLERNSPAPKKGEPCRWTLEWFVNWELLTPRPQPQTDTPWRR